MSIDKYYNNDPKLEEIITDTVSGVIKNRPISETIRDRLVTNNRRFFANDCIADQVSDEEREQLISELTEKFEGVLDTLLIDRENDPNSKGTAKRLAKMYINELMSGRFFPAPDVTAFPNDGSHGTTEYTGMLVVRAELKSMCSHHHQIVSGVAYIGIIPSSKVIGLSKYTRIAQHCARRGTLQEELCTEIAAEIIKATGSENVAVYIKARHNCCEARGIMAHNSMTSTTVLHGQFFKDDVKSEFYENIKLQERGGQ